MRDWAQSTNSQNALFAEVQADGAWLTDIVKSLPELDPYNRRICGHGHDQFHYDTVENAQKSYAKWQESYPVMQRAFNRFAGTDHCDSATVERAQQEYGDTLLAFCKQGRVVSEKVRSCVTSGAGGLRVAA